MSERPRVVVGIDGSSGSRTALQFALEAAARRGTGVRVVSALLPPPYWPEKMDETPAKATASAKHGD